MSNLRESKADSISAIVPTVGRADSLRALLESLARQTRPIDEVVIADASSNSESASVVKNPEWRRRGLVIKHVPVYPPHAVRQRIAAINATRGDHLLFLDDDVVLEPDCVRQMLTILEKNDDVVAVAADFNNEVWPQPVRLWQWYLRHVLKLDADAWQGKVVGPLLRFGYNPVPSEPRDLEWFGLGNSLVRSSAFVRAGGFSDFFLHRCTMNEDIDLALKLRKVGRIMFCPTARLAHNHAPSGRVSSLTAAEDDLFNRFFILRRTVGYGLVRSFSLVLLYFAVETTSHFLGCIKRLNFRGFIGPFSGRLCAFGRILIPIVR